MSGSSFMFGQSLWIGIVSLIIVGASWCLTGLVMGVAPKKNIDPGLVQLFGALCSTIVGLILGFSAVRMPTCSLSIVFLACGAYFIGCLMNFFMLQLMSEAMQNGPNGVIWAIIQSAFIFPFIGGIVFFDVAFTLLRGIGIVLLLAALVCFALVKDNRNSSGSGKWKRQAFTCLVIVAIQQNITTAPSYFEEVREIPGVFRALAASLGTLTPACVLAVMQYCRSPEYKCKMMDNLKNFNLWKYVFALQFFSLLFAYTLFYPGMDIMAKAGLGGMCYPLMVGSCIVSFTLSSMFLLKEKVKPIQFAALVLCLTGLFLICLPA